MESTKNRIKSAMATNGGSPGEARKALATHDARLLGLRAGRRRARK